jgi:excisionase family DNA binding protein
MTVMNALTIAMLLRPEETARLLGISRSNAYGMLASGELPSIRLGRSIRVPRDALFRYIESNTTGGEIRVSA